MCVLFFCSHLIFEIFIQLLDNTGKSFQKPNFQILDFVCLLSSAYGVNSVLIGCILTLKSWEGGPYGKFSYQTVGCVQEKVPGQLGIWTWLGRGVVISGLTFRYKISLTATPPFHQPQPHHRADKTQIIYLTMKLPNNVQCYTQLI